MSSSSFHYYLVYMKNTPDSFLCNSMSAWLSSPILLRGSLFTSHKFERPTVWQLHKKRMLPLWPQQIIPKDVLLIYTKNVKALPQLFALVLSTALPLGSVWGTCRCHAGDTWGFGFLRSSLPDVSPWLCNWEFKQIRHVFLSEIGNEEISEDRCCIMHKNLQLEFHMTASPRSDLNRRELSLLLPLPLSPGVYTAIALSLLTIQIQADLGPQFLQGPVSITSVVLSLKQLSIKITATGTCLLAQVTQSHSSRACSTLQIGEVTGHFESVRKEVVWGPSGYHTTERYTCDHSFKWRQMCVCIALQFLFFFFF